MKSILILAFSDLRHDARIARQIDFLKARGPITVVCFDAPSTWPHEVIRIKRIRPGFLDKAIASFLLLTKVYEQAYNILYDFPELRRQMVSRNFDLIIANDIECLPLAVRIKKKEKILFDAHEYAPRHFEDRLVWRILFQAFNYYLCRRYLPLADAITTVGQGLAEEYAKNFRVTPIIVTNAAYYCDRTPTPVTPGRIRLIHHGAANPSRQLELMIQMMDFLDNRFTLDMMLLTPAMANRKTRRYLDNLRGLVAHNPRVKVIDAVPGDKVIDVIHNYDMGVFLLPPINFNYANTLPNKFFDFVQARLAIAIGPTPEMQALVQKFDLGVVSDDFSPKSLATRINSLTENQVSMYKDSSDKAAQELSAEQNKQKLNNLVRDLIGD